MLYVHWPIHRQPVRFAQPQSRRLNLNAANKKWDISVAPCLIRFTSRSKACRQINNHSQIMAAKGIEYRTKVLSTDIIEADERVAKGLQINIGDATYYIERVQYVYNEPVTIENLYFNAALLPNLLQYDFAKESIYQTLADKYNKNIIRVEQKISTLDIKGEYAKILFEKQSGTALYVRGASYDVNAVPVEYGRTFINGNKFSLDVLIQ